MKYVLACQLNSGFNNYTRYVALPLKYCIPRSFVVTNTNGRFLVVVGFRFKSDNASCNITLQYTHYSVHTTADTLQYTHTHTH